MKTLRQDLRAPRAVWVAGILCVALCTVHMAGGMTYYLAPPPRGNDTHTGANDAPWATFEKGLAALAPGDSLLLHDGRYHLTRPVYIGCRGTSNAWITIGAAPGATAVLDGAAWMPARHQMGSALLFVHKAAFVRLHGLRVANSRAAGIMIRGPEAEHIDVVACASDRSHCPGIGAWHARHVRVIGCEVTGANLQELRPPDTPPRREAPHEAISIASVHHFEVASNHVHHCAKEGIDIKETSAHGRVHRNHVHHVHRQGLYVDAWFGLLEDVTFDYNRSESNGFFGMAVSVEGKEARLHNVRIHDNELLHNGGSGLFFSIWGSNGPRAGIDVRRNMIIGNGGKIPWAGPTGGIDIKSRNCRDVLIISNTCVDNAQFQIATFDDPADGLHELAAQNIVITGNRVHPWRDDTDHPSPYGRVYALTGAQAITNGTR